MELYTFATCCSSTQTHTEPAPSRLFPSHNIRCKKRSITTDFSYTARQHSLSTSHYSALLRRDDEHRRPSRRRSNDERSWPFPYRTHSRAWNRRCQPCTSRATGTGQKNHAINFTIREQQIVQGFISFGPQKPTSQRLKHGVANQLALLGRSSDTSTAAPFTTF